MSNNSIWFAVDEDGIEFWFTVKPKRYKDEYWRIDHMNNEEDSDRLFPGAIQAITGRTLTWEDEPLEWKPGGSKELTKDDFKELINAHIEVMWGGLEMASVKYWMDTGKPINGSFMNRLISLMRDAISKSKNQ